MDGDGCPSGTVCGFCGEAFKLPEEEEEGEGNLPRLLLCGHIYCTVCLQAIKRDNVIKCPECEMESTLPEAGVCGLQEDSRIIGLIFTAKMNKMKRSHHHDKLRIRRRIKSQDSSSVDMEKPLSAEKFEKALDEALARAAENLAQLEFISESLAASVSEQVDREKARLETEIVQASNKAVRVVQKWKEAQLGQLTDLDAPFSSSRSAVRQVREVKERIKVLETAMQMASEVRRLPSLEQYCTLDKVLKTLQAPVEKQSFRMDPLQMDSGMRCVLKSEVHKQSLELFLKMEVGNSKHFFACQREHLWKSVEQRNGGFNKATENKFTSPQRRRPLSPHRRRPLSPRAKSPLACRPSPPPRRFRGFPQSPLSDHTSPDVIIEEVIHDEPEQALPPTGPELANDKWRIHRIKKRQYFGREKNDGQWVVVTHVVTPSHFYVQYVVNKKGSEILSQRINHICSQNGGRFAPSDTLETGSMVFVRPEDGLWCRARVVEMSPMGSEEAVNACAVTRIASVRVFYLDHGLTESIAIPSQEGAVESTPMVLHDHLRKVDACVSVDLQHFPPQAVRCSLKDLVPYDLTKGWSKEARVEFCSVVGGAELEMHILGKDRDSLVVDLRKAPMNKYSDEPISVREYLVFIEVARFYAPVILGRRPLLYYPPVFPKLNMELKALVSHINSPADFYIQLVDNMESMLLSAKLRECYAAAGDELSIYCPVIGQACIARFEDKMWCRAQVTGHPGGRKVEVRYVDFGKSDVLPVSDLRKIKDEFFTLPAMAIHCTLSDVVPAQENTWSDVSTDRFISLAHRKLLTVVATASVPKMDPLPVKLFEGGPTEALTSISGLLVKEQLACFKERTDSKKTDDSAVWDPPLDLAAAADQTEDQDQDQEQDQDQTTTGEQEFDLEPKLPTQFEDLKVRVTHINSPSSFYVHLSQNDLQLQRISERVKQECAHTEPPDVAWTADSYCAAHTNGVWQRGQICGQVTPDNMAEVRLSDRGNRVNLPVSDLRPLPSSLIGSLALECTINDIRPAGGRTSWTDTACDLFSYYVMGASAVLTIKEFTDKRPVPVTLLCSNTKGQLISISDFLISEGLAFRNRAPRDAVLQRPQRTDAPSERSESHAEEEKNARVPASPAPTPPKPAPRLMMSAEKVKTSSYLPPELLCLGLTKIRVTAIGDDGVIYIRSQSAERQLELLKERIQQSMKAVPRQKPYTWKSVLGCAVLGADMRWYRGHLLEMVGGHVKVHYVDYGKVENIPMVHVSPVLLCEDVPQLSLPCQLLGINPVGGKWQRDGVALLREVLVSRSVDMQVVELPADPKGSLTVEIFIDGLNLSKILCQHQHASMDGTVSSLEDLSAKFAAPVLDIWDINTEGLDGPEDVMLGPFVEPNLPEEGELFQVRVTHLQTPNEVFLSPLDQTMDVEVDGETLDEALERINGDIESLPRLGSFPRGGPCLAEYSDGRYYRAKLLTIASVEPVSMLVQHVDFGSEDRLPTSKLRQMPAELLKFPSRALKVKVAGFKAPPARRHEDVLPYSPNWSVKAVMEMIDLLHNNITASVVAREPQLTVLLYNEDGQLVHLPLVSSGLAEFE